MPDPITGAIVAKAATSVAAASSSITSDAEQVALGLLTRMLGPAADEIGQALGRWTSYRVGNVKRIAERADQKSRRFNREGISNPRVANVLLEAGSYCDDELMDDYLGGVLAGSKTPTGRDDRAVTWSALITRVSSFQVRAHYLLYREWAARLVNTNAQLWLQGRPNPILYVELNEFTDALVKDSGVEGYDALTYALSGLSGDGLIGDWAFGNSFEVYIKFPPIPNKIELPFEKALRVMPTMAGVELYGWAMGIWGLPGVNVRTFPWSVGEFELPEPIPRLEQAFVYIDGPPPGVIYTGTAGQPWKQDLCGDTLDPIVRRFTVNPFLTVKRRIFSVVVFPCGAAVCTLWGPQSGGFDTGAAAVRLPAIGRPSQVARISPMEPPRGVPVSNPPRLHDFLGFQRPRFLPFAPVDRR